MKRILLSLLLLTTMAVTATADRTFSFQQISYYCPQTGQTNPGNNVVAITIGDGYVTHILYGQLKAVMRNLDGSTTYMPTRQYAPGMRCDALLISADLMRMEIRTTMSTGISTMNMVEYYQNAGEDGGMLAQSWANAYSSSSSSSYDSGSSSSSSSRRSRSSSSGTCSKCGGTGVDPYPNSGASLSNWKKYYNSAGTACPYCRQATEHWHDRCPRCNAPGSR